MKMNKYYVLALTLMTGIASATKFRVPLISQIHGYDFDPKDESGWRVTMDATNYTRQADRAFDSSHGTGTNNLSALFFNKDSFRLSNIFLIVRFLMQLNFYNPFMRVITIAPRAQYYEEGDALCRYEPRCV